MTNLEYIRMMNLPNILNIARIFKGTDDKFTKFEYEWAKKLTEYFSTEPAAAVNYNAVWYDGHIRRNGTLTVKRNGDFTFMPA